MFTKDSTLPQFSDFQGRTTASVLVKHILEPGPGDVQNVFANLYWIWKLGTYMYHACCLRWFKKVCTDSRAFYCWRLAVLAQEKNILLTLIHWSWLLYFLYACCWNAHVYRSTIRYKTSFWVQCVSNACKIQIVFILLHVINPVSHSLTVKKFLACLSRKQ